MSTSAPISTTADASQKDDVQNTAGGETCTAPEGAEPPVNFPVPDSDQREASKSSKHDGNKDSSTPAAGACSKCIEKGVGAQTDKIPAKPNITIMNNNKITIPPKAKITWDALMEQIRQEEELKGTLKSLSVTLSVCSSLVRNNGYELDEEVDSAFMEKISLAVKNGELSQTDGLAIPPSAAGDTSYCSRVGRLVRGYDALTRASFSEVLRDCIAQSGLTHKTIATKSGLTVPQIRDRLARGRAGVCNVSRAQALALDNALGAEGKIIAAFVATDQSFAYGIQGKVMDEVLGRETFHQKLRELRKDSGLTIECLLKQVADATHAELHRSQLSHWEQGLYVPSEQQRGVIEAFDQAFRAEGTLVALWEASLPREVLEKYCFPCRDWPKSLLTQFEHLVEYKKNNPDQWERSKTKGGDRWTSTASSGRFRTFVEKFYGYLLQERNITKEELSLTLLCQWPLVQGLFSFVAGRVGNTKQSLDAYTRSGCLLNLYTYYFPHLAKTISLEKYWTENLPTQEIHTVTSASGYTREFTTDLLTLEDRWKYQVFLAGQKARAFMAQDPFKGEALCQRAQPLLDEETPLAELAKEVAARVGQLPRRILNRKAAIISRRLAIVALLFGRVLRPGTIDSLLTSQVKVIDGKIHLNIPEEQFKQRGKGGSAGGMHGQIPDIEWIHTAIRRYLDEARPILLGVASGRNLQDAGYFFISAISKRRLGGKLLPGGKLGNTLIVHDVNLIMGYNPYAQRYLFASDGWGLGMNSEEVANVLGNTAAVTDKVYTKRTVIGKTRRANRSVENVLGGEANGKK